MLNDYFFLLFFNDCQHGRACFFFSFLLQKIYNYDRAIMIRYFQIYVQVDKTILEVILEIKKNDAFPNVILYDDFKNKFSFLFIIKLVIPLATYSNVPFF